MVLFIIRKLNLPNNLFYQIYQITMKLNKIEILRKAEKVRELSVSANCHEEHCFYIPSLYNEH